MVRIAISQAAFDAIAKTLALDSKRAYLLLIDRRPEVVRKMLAEMRAEVAREREDDLAFAM